MKEKIMSQSIDDFRAAEKDLRAEIGNVAQRVTNRIDALEAKLREAEEKLSVAGTPVDLTSDLAELRSDIDALHSIAAPTENASSSPTPEPLTPPSGADESEAQPIDLTSEATQGQVETNEQAVTEGE
ncbi:MAG: hypothetical protein AUG51_16995 [Acidobacteria bacterium 13_1_20CM_3_53_8]|nr:MAG: hypothetical protein AUG51_16995 [Acidobacteria bacterium 13_1_20CM_3_53_8]